MAKHQFGQEIAPATRPESGSIAPSSYQAAAPKIEVSFTKTVNPKYINGESPAIYD